MVSSHQKQRFCLWFYWWLFNQPWPGRDLAPLPVCRSRRALRPPGWLPQWHCGVRVSSNKKLVGFISAIPADIRIYDTWGLVGACSAVTPSPSWRFHPSRLPFLAQTEEDGRNKLPVRSQEAALEARGPRAHQGDHAAGEPGGNISSCLHSRGGAAQTRFHVQVVLRLQTLNTRTELDIASSSPSFILYFCMCQVLASFSEPQEAGGGEVLPPQQKHDPAENHEAVQTTRCKKRLISLVAAVCCSLPRLHLTPAFCLLPFVPIKSTKTPGLRPMERRDIPQVTELLQKYLKRFQLAPTMGEQEVAHWFLPQDNIIDTYVVEVSRISLCHADSLPVDPSVKLPLCPQGDGGVLTDFTSFYTLPSTVMHHPLHRSLKAAYSFYNVYTQTPLLDLMNDALILAKLVRSSLYLGSLSSQELWHKGKGLIGSNS